MAKVIKGSNPLLSAKTRGLSDNGSTSALHAESRGSIPLDSTGKQIGDIMADLKNEMYNISHGVWKFIESLDVDELNMLRMLLSAVTEGKHTNTYNYYAGYIDRTAYSKYEVCPTCNTKHEDGDTAAFNSALQEKLTKAYGEETAKAYRTFDKQTDEVTEDIRPGNYL